MWIPNGTPMPIPRLATIAVSTLKLIPSNHIVPSTHATTASEGIIVMKPSMGARIVTP